MIGYGVAAKRARSGQPVILKGRYAQLAIKNDVHPVLPEVAVFKTEDEAKKMMAALEGANRAWGDYEIAKYRF